MCPVELERDLAYAAFVQAQGHKTWVSAVAELRSALRPKRPSGSPSPSPVATTQVFVLPPAALNGAATALSAVLRKIAEGRHPLYLALSGTLLRRGLEPDVLPAFIASVARQAGDAKVANRVADAVSSARAWERGGRVVGYPTLRAHWPAVASAVDAHFPRSVTAVESQVHKDLDAPMPMGSVALLTAEESTARMLAAACANPGTPRVVILPPGVGKTRKAVEFALQHQGRVAIVHGTNKVAEDHFRLAESTSPGSSLRRFGVLALIGTDGRAVCKKSVLATVLQTGGLPVQQRLCVRCEHREGCTAHAGIEGVPTAQVGFFNHAMLATALEHAGSQGLVVIDECPPVFIHGRISVLDLEATYRVLHSYEFPAALADPCAPLIRLLLAEADTVDDGDALGSKLQTAASSLRDSERLDLTLAAKSLGQFEAGELDSFDKPVIVPTPVLSGQLANDAVALFRVALEQWPNHQAPPTTRSLTRQLGARFGVPAISDLVTATKTLVALRRAFNVSPEAHVRASWQVDDSDAVLIVTYENPALAAALRRPGPTVLLDATADERGLRKVAQRRVHTERHHVVDGAPVTRILIANAKGAKRHLSPKNSASWPVFGAALADALEHAGTPAARNILIVTHKACADALRTTRVASVPHARLRRLLERHAEVGSRIAVGHFGDVRGRNEFEGLSWKELDLIVTVGDPWPDIGQANTENRCLELSLDEGNDRIRQLVADELGQAHGRLRAPRQTKPTFAVHVGSIVPAAWNAANTTVATALEGRRPSSTTMTKEELLALVAFAGSRRALARATKTNESNVRRYLQGRAIPADFAAKVRKEFGPAQNLGDGRAANVGNQREATSIEEESPPSKS